MTGARRSRARVSAGDVRGDGDARMRPVGMVGRQRLGRGRRRGSRGATWPRVERGEQRRVVDQAAAAGVDRRRAPRGQQREARGRRAGSRSPASRAAAARGSPTARAPSRGRPRRRWVATPGSVPRPAAPAGDVEAEPRERLRRAAAELAEAEHADACGRGRAAGPTSWRQTPSWPRTCASMPEVVAQHVAGDPFRPCPRSCPGSTMRQSGTRIVGLPTMRSTPAQRLSTAFSRVNGREVGDRRRRGRRRRSRRSRPVGVGRSELDVEALGGGARARRCGRQSGQSAAGAEKRTRGHRRQSRARGRWTCALCARPKAASSTSIAEPP